MKRFLLIVILVLMAFIFAGCSNIKTIEGPFIIYHDDERIGQVDYIKESGGLICIVNSIHSYDQFDYLCWDKEDITYVKVEED